MSLSIPTPLLDVSVRSTSATTAVPGVGETPADQETVLVGQQVESMFASILIKSMRQTLGEEGLFPGDKSDALGGLFDMYMGQQVGKSKGLGIAEIMESYTKNLSTA